MRAQLVVALVVGLVLLAVPLYLWRRPSGTEAIEADAAADAAPNGSAEAGVTRMAIDAAPPDERVRLGTPARVKCSASPRSRGQEGNLCDQMEFFEKALAKAIRDNVDCAPRTGKEGTINYVLTVDFAHRAIHVFPGASGQWKGPQARRSAKCVKRSLPAPAWDSIRHQYKYYIIAILATYPAPGSAGVPLFQ